LRVLDTTLRTILFHFYGNRPKTHTRFLSSAWQSYSCPYAFIIESYVLVRIGFSSASQITYSPKSQEALTATSSAPSFSSEKIGFGVSGGGIVC
jgi:hypothetical protein